MLSVILADDEPVILRGLTKLIPWDKHDVEIIGEAGSGDELLQAIIERSPDIVITDISMPGLSGIDVLRLIKELGKPTKVIFISAYQEFAYARDAVSYGAVDYLVKPVDRVKLEQVLAKTVAMIREAAEQHTKQSLLVTYEKQQKAREVTDFFDRLTEGERVPEEMLRDLRGNRLSARFTVVTVKQDHYPNHSGSWLEGEWKLLQFAMQNVMEEIIQASNRGWVIPKADHFVAVIHHEDEREAEAAAVQIHDNLNRFLKLSVTVGVGLPVTLELLADSYRQANEAAAYKFFAGTNRLFRYRDLPQVPSATVSDFKVLEKELVKSVILPQHGEQKALEEYIAALNNTAWGNRDYAVTLIYTTLLALFREMGETGVPYRAKKEDQQQLGQKLSGAETFDELVRWLREELQLAEAAVSSQGSHKEKQHLRQVKAYIEEHYAEDLTLERLAALAYMNPYYFSSAFKKHAGQNFKHYLTEVRMKHALRYLQETDLMVYEIAEKIGYRYARQFSDMFKKHYGKLPHEYR